jgi:hypothetical protein
MAESLYGNNNIPLAIGGKYLLTPGGASQDGWVIIENLTNDNVYVLGLNNNTAVLTIPRWKFDDLVSEYEINGFHYTRYDYNYVLLTDSGERILF